MIAFFVVLALLSAPQLVRSTGIFLSLFTDEHCSTPSTTNPNLTIGINVCVVTAGLKSFIYTPVACTTGLAKAWVFTDVGCAKPVDPGWYYAGGNENDYCYAAYVPGVFPALMLTCDADADEVTPSRPTSTTTIAVGPVVNAATSTTGNVAQETFTTSLQGVQSSTGTLPTDLSIDPLLMTGIGTTEGLLTSSSTGTSSSNTPGGGDSLSRPSEIATIAGTIAGVLSLIIAFLTWRNCCGGGR
jgi:hypothetical protein